jgi:hypothetical protein
MEGDDKDDRDEPMEGDDDDDVLDDDLVEIMSPTEEAYADFYTAWGGRRSDR